MVYIPKFSTLSNNKKPIAIGPIRLDPPSPHIPVYQRIGLTLEESFDNSKNCSPVEDQGNEGSCVGFGGKGTEETVTNAKRAKQSFFRRILAGKIRMSARWFYEEAKKNDEWEGEDYEGSSILGGLTGAQKVGTCLHSFWPYKPNDSSKPLPGAEKDASAHKILEPIKVIERWNESSFPGLFTGQKYIKYKGLKKIRQQNILTESDLLAIKETLVRYGALNVGTLVHNGWTYVGSDGIIKYNPNSSILGGHAICVVGYNNVKKLFKFKNSWGTSWGEKGYGYLSYDDFAVNALSIWALELDPNGDWLK